MTAKSRQLSSGPTQAENTLGLRPEINDESYVIFLRLYYVLRTILSECFESILFLFLKKSLYAN